MNVGFEQQPWLKSLFVRNFSFLLFKCGGAQRWWSGMAMGDYRRGIAFHPHSPVKKKFPVGIPMNACDRHFFSILIPHEINP